jgi:hypothetical protein
MLKQRGYWTAYAQGEKKCIAHFGVKHLKRIEYLGDIGVDARIILK